MTNHLTIIGPIHKHAIQTAIARYRGRIPDDWIEASDALDQPVSCAACVHWEAYSPHRGKCSHYKQMTADDMACPSWGHRP